MKGSMSKMSRGWSFAAGTFLGALAVIALPLTSHGSRSKAEAAERAPVAASAAGLTADSVSAAEYKAADWVVKAAPEKGEKSKAAAADSEKRLQDHSELELQCD